MNTSWTRSALAAALSTLLAACNGGGGSDSNSSATISKPDTDTPQKVVRNEIRLDQITDPALRNCIERLNIDYTDQLQLLNCSAEGVQSLDGIEQFSHTIVINLMNNQISDLSPLASVVSMQSLDISNNSLTDLSPLSQHKALRILSASNNRLTDIDTLKKMGTLQRLYVQNNAINDLSMIGNLPGLVSLRADQNPAPMPEMIPSGISYRI
ncbi:MAG: leucine-rich repeat domain-containing protein [Gammaproteobacteria bacterium]|nr:leucine-rich repeat domain-containing protein [Gammaproteobacteria bacterium]